jgi:cullin 3
VKENNNEKVQSKVEDDRRFTIDASIMKVMKSRRKIDYQ